MTERSTPPPATVPSPARFATARRARLLAAFMLCFWLVILATLSASVPEALAPWTFVAGLAVIGTPIVRTARASVTVNGDEVTVRNNVRTYVLKRSEITAVAVGEMAGLGPNDVAYFERQSAKRLQLHGITGFAGSRRVADLVVRLAAVLQVPYRLGEDSPLQQPPEPGSTTTLPKVETSTGRAVVVLAGAVLAGLALAAASANAADPLFIAGGPTLIVVSLVAGAWFYWVRKPRP